MYLHRILPSGRCYSNKCSQAGLLLFLFSLTPPILPPLAAPADRGGGGGKRDAGRAHLSSLPPSLPSFFPPSVCLSFFTPQRQRRSPTKHHCCWHANTHTHSHAPTHTHTSTHSHMHTHWEASSVQTETPLDCCRRGEWVNIWNFLCVCVYVCMCMLCFSVTVTV